MVVKNKFQLSLFASRTSAGGSTKKKFFYHFFVPFPLALPLLAKVVKRVSGNIDRAALLLRNIEEVMFSDSKNTEKKVDHQFK